MKKFFTYSEFKDINILYKNIFSRLNEHMIDNNDVYNGIKIPESLNFIEKSDIHNNVYHLVKTILILYVPNINTDMFKLATLVSIGNIYYVDDKCDNPETIKNDLQFLLEELQMNGIGNGIVKSISNILDSLVIVYNYLYKSEIVSFIDIYESKNDILKKIINALTITIKDKCDKNDIDGLGDKLSSMSSTFMTTDINVIIDNIIDTDNKDENLINENK